MDGLCTILEAATAAQEIDEDTRVYLLECLRDADRTEWKGIVCDFLQPQSVEAIATLAAVSQEETPDMK